MAYTHALLLLAGLAYLPNSCLAGNLTSDKVPSLNSNFEEFLKNNLDAVKEILEKTGGGTLNKDMNLVAVRLYFEGMLTGWVTGIENPLQNKNKSLVISGYGGKGAAALAFAKERAVIGEKVTLLLLPFGNGARGTNGVIKTNESKHYERLESWLRAWNHANGNKITFVSVMDDDTKLQAFTEAKTVFEGAYTELKKLLELKDAVKAALAQANNDKNAPTSLAADAALSAQSRVYYTVDGVPCGELETEIAKVMKAVLESIGDDYDYCFEAHSGQGFQAAFGTHFSEPIMKFLMDLKKKGVKLTSTDYQLGTTNAGLQKDIDQYEPDMIIVISLLPSLLAKKVEDLSYEQKKVKIVQIDWNTVCKSISVQSLPPHLSYTVAPKIITAEEKSTLPQKINEKSIDYRVLKSMDTFKNDWDTAAAAA